MEVAFQPVADRLVPQHARPARSQHDRHLAGRRGHRLQVDQRLADRLVGLALPVVRLEDVAVGGALAAAGAAGFHAAAVGADHADIEPHQRAHVGGAPAAGADDLDHLPRARRARSRPGAPWAPCRAHRRRCSRAAPPSWRRPRRRSDCRRRRAADWCRAAIRRACRPCPARTALTVATARFSAASSSAEAWAKPVASPATERRPKPWVVSYEALFSLPSSNDRLSLCSYSRNSSPSSQPASASSTIFEVRRWSSAALAEEQAVGGGEMVDRLAHGMPFAARRQTTRTILPKWALAFMCASASAAWASGKVLSIGRLSLPASMAGHRSARGRLDDGAHFLGRAGAEGDADIVDALQRMQVEVELALHAAEPADIDDAAEDGGGLHVLVGDAGRDLVDDQVDALAAGRLLDLVRPFRIARCRARDRSRTP